MAKTSEQLADAKRLSRERHAQRMAELSALIAKRSALPFEAMLTDLLARAPSVNWKRLALSDPLKFVQCVERLALLSGYQPAALAPTTNVLVVEKMSDAALVAALAAARATTPALPVRTPIDVDVPVNPAAPSLDVNVTPLGVSGVESE